MRGPQGQGLITNDEASLRQELGRDERLLWHGALRQGVRLRASDALAIPVSLMWGGFALFWESSVVAAPHAPVFMALWGVPFVLVGVYMIIGRFFADAYVRGRTVYGLTDQRVVIVGGVFAREVKSLPLATLGEITITERTDSSGTIAFGSTPGGRGMMMRGTPWPGAGKTLPPAFDLIDRVRNVYDPVIRAQDELRHRVVA